jgi:hypothetical protein
MNLNRRKYLVIISISLGVLTLLTMRSPVGQPTYAASTQTSGYNHGCSDAQISNPADRYINQPEKGPGFHTGTFMQAYNEGFNACSGNSNSQSRSGGNFDGATNEPSGIYYEGLNWWGICNNSLVRSYISQPCESLVTPDHRALTYQGKVVLESILCPKGPPVLSMIEGFYGPIPDKAKNELSIACGWQ